VVIKTVVGDVKLKVPEGTQSETIFRVREKGAPVVGREGQRGDHYVRIVVDIPKKLSKQEKQIWEELKK
jgi:molecular chaperone DnaJ